MRLRILSFLFLNLYFSNLYADCSEKKGFPLRVLCLDSIPIYLDNFLTKDEFEKKNPKQQVREDSLGGFPYKEFTSPYGPPYNSMYSPKNINSTVTFQASYLKSGELSNLAAYGKPSGILMLLNPEAIKLKENDIVEVKGKIELFATHPYGDEVGIRIQESKLLFTAKQKKAFVTIVKEFLNNLNRVYGNHFYCFNTHSLPTDIELFLWDNAEQNIIFPFFAGQGRVNSKFYLVLDTSKMAVKKLYASCTIYLD